MDSFKPADKSPISGTPAEAPPGGAPLILVVDDVEFNQIIVKSLLEKRGCVVETASSGEEAVSKAILQPFQLILMDCHMPGMDGFEATRQIRNLPGPHSQVPIVALTADAAEEIRERALESGMNDWISKPVKADGLAAVLARWIPVQNG